jgi:hypothetical protein
VEGVSVSDALVFRFERDIRELTYDLQRGSQHAHEIRALLLRRLAEIRPSIRADDGLRLEQLIDGRTK